MIAANDANHEQATRLAKESVNRAYETTLAFDNTESLRIELYNVVVANGQIAGGGLPGRWDEIRERAQLVSLLRPVLALQPVDGRL